MILIPAYGAIIGAWFGAWPMPLDWERPWQVMFIYLNIQSNQGLGSCSWLWTCGFELITLFFAFIARMN